MSEKYQFDAVRFCRNNAQRMGQMPNGRFVSELMLEEISALRLRAEQAEARCKMLEESLREIASLYWQDAPCPQEMRDIARKALEDK